MKNIWVSALPGQGRLTLSPCGIGEDLKSLKEQLPLWAIICDGTRLIAAIGDSIIAGHPNHDGSPDFYDGTRAQPDYAPSSIWFWLRMWLPHYFIMNQGIGSTSSTYWLSNGTEGLRPPFKDGSITGSMIYEKALRFKPAYLFIGVGSNDIFGGLSLEDTLKAVERICDEAAEAGTIPIILSVPYLGKNHREDNEENRQRIRTLNSLYRKMVSQKEYDAYFVDYAEAISNGSGSTRNEFLADSVHPNEVGYQVAAREIIKGVPFKAPKSLKYILFHWSSQDMVIPKRLLLSFGASSNIAPERGYESTQGYSRYVADEIANGRLKPGREVEILVPDKPYHSTAFYVPEELKVYSYEMLLSIRECHSPLSQDKVTGFSKIEYIYSE
jgi:hypothetical protein